jgi:hypothetical protein
VRDAARAAATPGRVCGLYVFISNPNLLADLQYALQRTDCAAEQQTAHVLDVSVPSAPDKGQALRELNVYLATWQAGHRGVEAYVIEEEPAR